MRLNGNPGTGKTVVARLVGKILTALGAIKPFIGGGADDEFTAFAAAYEQMHADQNDEDRPLIFKEVSRADLVGSYKGHTAPKVKAAVKEANGGVLFIDEAYSLVKHSRDTFGKEAVDTLIQEIENHRKHVVVIFAGYSRNMDEFFESNPGFKSRVPFTLDFEDYSCQQLMGIADIQ